ncbi:unnamed protein product, partial [Mesorhabditis spiculigera]
MILKKLLVFTILLILVDSGAIWDSNDRVWKTIGETRGLPTPAGNCIPPQPPNYPTAGLWTYERQYQLRQGPGDYMSGYTTLMDCFNACFNNKSCLTMWFAGYNRSCTHWPYTDVWVNYNQTVQRGEYVYAKRYSPFIYDPKLYTVVNPLVSIRQVFIGNLFQIKYNSSSAADGAIALCVAWRPALKCSLQPYQLGLGLLEPYVNRGRAFFLSTEKTSECGSFMDIYKKSAGNGIYYYSNANQTTGWTKVDGIYSWDTALC